MSVRTVGIVKLVEYFAGPQSAYHIGNLQEALKIAPDTGDWHGELRYVLNELVKDLELEVKPNVKFDDQIRTYFSRDRA